MEQIPFVQAIKWILAGLVITLPLSPRIGSLFMILLGVVGILNAIKSRTINRLPNFVYLLAVCYFVRVIWVIVSTDREYAFKALETELPLLAVPLLFSLFNVDEQLRKFVSTVFVLTCVATAAFAFYTLAAHIQTIDLTGVDYIIMHLGNRKQSSEANMLTWPHAHPTFLSMMMIYGLQIMLFSNDGYLSKRLVILAYSLVAGAFILLSGSKFGLMMFVVSLLLTPVINRAKFFKKESLLMMGLSVTIITGLLVVFLLRDHPEKIDPIRPTYMTKAIKAWVQRPIFGYGTGATKEVVRDIELEKVGYNVNHPHNQILTDLVQFGMIGTIPLLLFIGMAFKYAIQNQERLLFLTLLTFTAFMMVESPFNSNKGAMPFLVVLGLISQSGATLSTNLNNRK